MHSRVVIGNVSTKPCPSGEVCRVAPGEHRHISQDSFFRFDYVRVTDLEALTKGLASGTLQGTVSASPDLVAKLQNAVLSSSKIQKEAQEIIRVQGVLAAKRGK